MQEECKTKKSTYILCKIGNWLIPMIALLVEQNLFKNGTYMMYMGSGLLLFIILWFCFSSTRSRLLYQSPIFIGHLLYLYCLYTSYDLIFHTFPDKVSVGEKIIMTALCILIFVCKIYTMVYETKDYNEDAGWRHNNRLQEKVDIAAYELEHARNQEERQRAMARLERAKLDYERYKRDE